MRSNLNRTEPAPWRWAHFTGLMSCIFRLRVYIYAWSKPSKLSTSAFLTFIRRGLRFRGTIDYPPCSVLGESSLSRQVVKHVDFVSFNLLFVPAMSLGGLAILSILSLPHPRSPPPPPRGPGDYLSLMEALLDQTQWKTRYSLKY